MAVKFFKTISVVATKSDTIPEATAVQIKNTAVSGEVTISNTIPGVGTYAFTIGAGLVQTFSGDWLSGEMTVSCDGDAAAQIIYWE